MTYDEILSCQEAIEKIVTGLTATNSPFNFLCTADRDEDDYLKIVENEAPPNDYIAKVSEKGRKLFTEVIESINDLYTHLYDNEEEGRFSESNGIFIKGGWRNEEYINQGILRLLDKMSALFAEELPHEYKDFFKEFAENTLTEIEKINEYVDSSEIRSKVDGFEIKDEVRTAETHISRNVRYNAEDILDDVMFKRDDRAALSGEGSPEYTDLKNAINEKKSMEDIFNASWEYLRRKDTVPWSTEGKKRVEAAAKVMASSALLLLERKDTPEGFREKVLVEMTRNKTFRDILISKIPGIINQDDPSHMKAAEIYSAAKACDVQCTKLGKTILYKGKMDAEDLSRCGRYQQAKEMAGEYEKIAASMKERFRRDCPDEELTPGKFVDLANTLHVRGKEKTKENSQPQKNVAAQKQGGGRGIGG